DQNQPGLWVDWFARNHEHFQAVRAALSVSPGDLSRLQVSWRRGEGDWRRVGGTKAELEAGAGSLRVLGARSEKELFAMLEAHQLLDSSVLPGTYGPFGNPVSSEIEIHVGRRRKRFLFRGGSSLPWLSLFLGRLDALWQTTQWELLAPEGQQPARSKFVLDRLDRWDAATKAGRAALMVAMTRGNLPRMDDEPLRSWAATLAAHPGLEGDWDLDLAREFLEELPARASHPEVAEAVLDAGLREPDPELTSALLEAAEPLKEPLRSDLLLKGLSRLGAAVCSDCLKDPHLAVRVAAARALGRAGSEGRDALLTALNDSNPLVVRMAVRSLGEQKDAAVLSSLLPLAGPTFSKDVRREALWALGEIADPQGLGVILAAARDADAAVRLAAVRALGKLSGPDVDPAFGELFPAYAGTPLEVSFLRSLSGRGAEAARHVLRPHLLSQDKVVVRRAALLLGALGDPSASPELISMLPDTPHDEELLDALAYCLCVDFRQMPDPAGNYSAWWRRHGGEDPRIWFNREATDLGWVIPEAFLNGDSAARAASVEAVLGILEEGPSHLHPAAAYHLQRLTGVDGPAIQGRTPKAVVRNLAVGWHQWLKERG
ncbi:MAG: HEAT repeat domain-containing protein, partial [Planctomycetota bacterium]